MTPADTLRADLLLNADPFLSYCDRLIETAQWRSSDPDEQVSAFIAAQLIQVRHRVEDYIATVAKRIANEQALAASLAQAVIEANCVKPEGLRRLIPADFAGAPLTNDNTTSGDAA